MDNTLKTSDQIDIVRRAVIKRGGSVTIGDIVSETGFDTETAKSCLNKLIATCEGVMRVSETGELLYAFQGNCIQRDQRSWWDRNKEAIYKAIKVFFKVIIFLFLVIYFIIYMVILIALLSQNKGRNNINLGSAIWIFWGRRDYDYDRSSDTKKSEPIYTRVFNFMFGPENPKKDPLELRTKCAQLIRARNGVVTVEDWMMISGQTREKCESDLARYTAEFDGDAQILENGTLVYVFPDVMKSMKSGARAPMPAPAWKTLEEPRKFTGNSGGGNAMVVGLNLFNLIMAYLCTAVIPTMLAAEAAQTGETINYMTDSTFLWLGLIPLIFSILIFAVPLLRIPSHIMENRRRRKEAVRKSMLSAIFDGNGNATTKLPRSRAVIDTNKAIRASYTQDVTIDEFNDAMTTLSDELGGDFVPNSTEETSISFPDMELRLKEASQKRQQLDLKSQKVGRVVFSTNNDEYDDIEAANNKSELEDFDRMISRDPSASARSRNQSRVEDEDASRALSNLSRYTSN